MNNLYTLEETIRDQKDLNSLCEDRALETGEIFTPNSYYGMDYVIKTYSGLPLKKSLKAIFPHGVNLSVDFIWKAEKNACLPVIYYYSPHRSKVYKNNSKKVVLPASSPFVYLTKLFNNSFAIPKKGTLFFLSHSTHHVTTLTDFKKIAFNLEKLKDEYKPISVCIYWRDFNLRHHEIFEQKGFKIVSAGHMFDPYFLFRLYHLCSIHKYAASNEIGSHIFYSVKAGCSFFLFNYEKTTKVASEKILQRDFANPDQSIVSNIKSLFETPNENTTPEQKEFVDEFLGTNYLKKPKELREHLKFAEKLDKYGFARHPENNKIFLKIPNLIIMRFLQKIRRNFYKLNLTHMLRLKNLKI